MGWSSILLLSRYNSMDANMRRMIMMCLLWGVGDAQAREYVWIKHRLLITHEFYNQIIYTRDITLWGQKDYWATPEETLRGFKGDCEDIAIAKYFSLLRQGIPFERLRLAYLLLASSAPKTYHLVLEYHHEDGIDVLDNRYSQIYSANEAYHAQTIVTFDLHYMWINNVRIGESQVRMEKWASLLVRHQHHAAMTLEKQRMTQVMPHLVKEF
ncbi:TPA: hypothetical protein I7272_21380 [Vibrio parahaemolyticus]|uniref:Sulfate adenylyltransferase n=3 Tax=Vibrionaceae TaxID=641 RepID=A0A1Y1BAC4_VIBPH|nr:transglutaminase-like cysteine peptidase [Vibrio parahaemolyticus]EGQ8535495.1 hypothetical protein [Vibrio parahaemolyticus]KAB5598054.1 hypothetical protein F0578_18890 [Vibrio parahaemolyticus]MCZ5860351.1 transglutaminase-like cysteine peptidase [Vibrio parahaemolyticus]MDN4712537.1 transglutaminase-like cysteine peptidase [Vibrio parahaemolyticus]MRE09464.1 hypothetical protein [Vibrio parahaemolyticus]